MGRRNRLTQSDIVKIKEMREGGYTAQEIADEVGASIGSIKYNLNKMGLTTSNYRPLRNREIKE